VRFSNYSLDVKRVPEGGAEADQHFVKLKESLKSHSMMAFKRMRFATSLARPHHQWYSAAKPAHMSWTAYATSLNTSSGGSSAAHVSAKDTGELTPKPIPSHLINSSIRRDWEDIR
jgi:hypothetical protein